MSEELYLKRRRELALLMQEGVGVIVSASQQIRSNDTEYPYRQNSDFYYLCGFEEDNSILTIIKEHNSYKTVLFVQAKDKKLELWTGKRLGVEGALERFKVDEVYDINEFATKIRDILKERNTLFLELFSEDKQYIKLKNIAEELVYSRGVKFSPRIFKDITVLTQQMRLIKDKEEIRLIKEALLITKEAHHKAMRICEVDMMEYALQAEYEYYFRKKGAYSDAYTSIIAGGDNANTLHYIKNDQPLCNNDLVLVDAGCEFKMYASDITRTFPINGKFTLAQKELYEMVLQVQVEVINAIRPKVTKKILQDLAEKLLCEGMVKLGILKGDVDKLIETKEHKKYFPHGIGHWMGLDVHDPSSYVDDKGEDILFKTGMVLTIEPGIYISKDDENVPKKYCGVGIRIEDNILVTTDGHENLSRDIVKSVEDIEAMCNS